MKLHSLPVLTVLALALVGCSKAPAPTATPNAQAPAPGGHDGHDHAGADRTELGKADFGEHRVTVFQVTPIVPGKEGDFDLEFGGTNALPATVRGWIGVESGVGSAKVRFEKETDRRMHGHPEVPSPLPAGAKFWLEIETAGATAKNSFAIKM